LFSQSSDGVFYQSINLQQWPYGTLLKTNIKTRECIILNGTSEDGYSTDEPYKFVITAVRNGKTETKTGLISHDADPSWLEDN
jgi:hypothetical protein